MLTLHGNLTKQDPKSTSSACEPPCLVHRIFGLSVIQQTCCSSCTATSEPLFTNAIIDYIPVSTLRAAAQEAFALSPRVRPSFSSVLCRARTGLDIRTCVNNECKKPSPVLQFLISRPSVFTIGLVWSAEDSPAYEIMETLDLIGQELDTSTLYHSQGEEEPCYYALKGMVSYLSCFFL